jgi:hypothetical protein
MRAKIKEVTGYELRVAGLDSELRFESKEQGLSSFVSRPSSFEQQLKKNETTNKPNNETTKKPKNQQR